MPEPGEHNKVFDIMDRMLESILVNEPRIRVLEFRVTILWWIICGLAGSLGAIIVSTIIWFIQKS